MQVVDGSLKVDSLKTTQVSEHNPYQYSKTHCVLWRSVWEKY